MPTYSYVCDACGCEFERRQSFHDEPIQVCPECEAEAVRRVIAPVGVIFKGSGWYVTDSKQGKQAGLAPGETADDAGSEKNGAGADEATTAEATSDAGAAASTDAKKDTAASSGAPDKQNKKKDTPSAASDG